MKYVKNLYDLLTAKETRKLCLGTNTRILQVSISINNFKEKKIDFNKIDKCQIFIALM